MAKKKRQTKKSRERVLAEGGSDSLTVRRFMGDVNVTIPRKVLRYLKVRPGDKVQVVARDGVIELAPEMSVEEEIALYVSQ